MTAGDQAFDYLESFFEASVLHKISSKVNNEAYPHTLYGSGESDSTVQWFESENIK